MKKEKLIDKVKLWVLVIAAVTAICTIDNEFVYIANTAKRNQTSISKLIERNHAIFQNLHTLDIRTNKLETINSFNSKTKGNL